MRPVLTSHRLYNVGLSMKVYPLHLHRVILFIVITRLCAFGNGENRRSSGDVGGHRRNTQQHFGPQCWWLDVRKRGECRYPVSYWKVYVDPEYPIFFRSDPKPVRHGTMAHVHVSPLLKCMALQWVGIHAHSYSHTIHRHWHWLAALRQHYSDALSGYGA